jgi:hypothetical protein
MARMLKMNAFRFKIWEGVTSQIVFSSSIVRLFY